MSSITESRAAALGWIVYGLGARAISGIVFMIGPLLLIDAARAADEANDSDEEPTLFGLIPLPTLLPTTIPQITITVGLLAQCVAAPVLAAAADRYGLRRLLLTFHVVLGLAACFLLGLATVSTPVVLQAFLLALLYYAMALAWMFQNALLPSVAPVARRPALSLASTAVSNVGGAAFLLVQYHALSSEDPLTIFTTANPFFQATVVAKLDHAKAIMPVGTATSAVVAAAAARAPSVSALHFVTLLAAAWWLFSAVLAIGLMATLRSEPSQPVPPNPPSSPLVPELVVQSWGKQPATAGGAGAPAAAFPVAVDHGAPVAAAALPPAPIHEEPSRPKRWRRMPGLFTGLRRLQRHKHASRFVLANTLYLTAATADGASASSFAQEVVGLNVATIIKLTIYAAIAGAFGSVATMGLARCFGARPTLCCLMCVPPLLLLYTSLILSSEKEFLIIGILHGMIHGGVGFHGLNRGVFAQMVPKGREAEFFGIYFVAIKLFSWLGPLACAVLNEFTHSLRTAVLSALVFYVPAILVLASSDFEEAKREAEAASHTPRFGRPSKEGPQENAVLVEGPRERLLPVSTTYGTDEIIKP